MSPTPSQPSSRLPIPAPFLFDGQAVRVLEIAGEPWFFARDVATVLGYANPLDAVRKHCKGVRETLTPSAGGKQSTNIIPERDVYRLIFRSKLPAAEHFEEYVVGTILPAIRRTGGFTLDEPLSENPIVLDQHARSAIGGIVKAVTEKVITTTVPLLVQAELAGDRNRLVVDNLTVGEILDKEGVASKGRRGLVNRCSRALAKFSATEGLVPRRTHPGRSGVCVYPPEMVQRWLGAAGRALIAAHRADRSNRTHDMFASFSATQVKP